MVCSSLFPFRVFPLLRFFAISLCPGHSPAHEQRCPSVGKRLMSMPITEIAIRELSVPRPVTSLIASTAFFSSGFMWSSIWASSSLICRLSSSTWDRSTHIISRWSWDMTPFRSSRICSLDALSRPEMAFSLRISSYFSASIVPP